MPMNRSGRSVEEASRVMEIEEVLVRGSLGLQQRTKLGKNLDLRGFILGRRFDHQIAVGELLEVGRRSDP